MGGLLRRTKETISEMIRRIAEVLKQNKLAEDGFQLQIVAYRNYNAPPSALLQV